jgi:carbon-monoxide dehydrogenase large subunit
VARRRAAEARGKLLGLGLANYVESSIGAPRERSEITITSEGRVKVVIGTGPSGQGHETSFAQVVGAVLAVPVEAIDVVTGDTDIVSLGGGSHSGRSMRHSATLFAKAAPELIANGKRVAARLLDASVDQVTFADGRFSAPPHNRSLDFLELAKEAPRLGEGELAVTTDNDMHDPVFPNGCAVCEVEVDPETGLAEIARYSVVDDVGRCINPLIVHGQTHGGVAQGVGEAMWEECVVDPASGQPLSGSFMDYGMPRSNSLPYFTTRIVEVLSPTNPFGIKAGGEGGCTPALAVVISAILDALAPLGVRDMTMPATPFKVWTAIQNARRQSP